ncbi:hypothetical protein Fmac_019937 [Flemingia macrophylla]|uniref:Uncharacterized protein n=1 Tax=Flemingia macrophylla TaxID=520843 RepID=A0ABD1M9B8_9FABA
MAGKVHALITLVAAKETLHNTPSSGCTFFAPQSIISQIININFSTTPRKVENSSISAKSKHTYISRASVIFTLCVLTQDPHT